MCKRNRSRKDYYPKLYSWSFFSELIGQVNRDLIGEIINELMCYLFNDVTVFELLTFDIFIDIRERGDDDRPNHIHYP